MVSDCTIYGLSVICLNFYVILHTDFMVHYTMTGDDWIFICASAQYVMVWKLTKYLMIQVAVSSTNTNTFKYSSKQQRYKTCNCIIISILKIRTRNLKIEFVNVKIKFLHWQKQIQIFTQILSIILRTQIVKTSFLMKKDIMFHQGLPVYLFYYFFILFTDFILFFLFYNSTLEWKLTVFPNL